MSIDSASGGGNTLAALAEAAYPFASYQANIQTTRVRTSDT